MLRKYAENAKYAIIFRYAEIKAAEYEKRKKENMFNMQNMQNNMQQICK